MPPSVHPEWPIHIHHDGQPGSHQIKQEISGLAPQCHHRENHTHGHGSCLENPFVVFDGVDELICSTLSFVRSLNMEPHPRTFPERSNSLWRGQPMHSPNLIHPSGQEQLGDSSPESAFDAGSVLSIQPYAMKQFLSVYIS